MAGLDGLDWLVDKVEDEVVDNSEDLASLDDPDAPDASGSGKE